MTPEKRAELRKAILDTIVDAVAVTKDLGAPGGTLYAILMAWGIDYHTFEYIMDELVKDKRVTKRGQLYFAVKGK